MQSNPCTEFSLEFQDFLKTAKPQGFKKVIVQDTFRNLEMKMKNKEDISLIIPRAFTCAYTRYVMTKPKLVGFRFFHIKKNVVKIKESIFVFMYTQSEENFKSSCMLKIKSYFIT